jgi:GT2 family glycosyltransferase
MKKYSVIIITADRHDILRNCLDKLFEFKVDKKADIVVVDASKNNFSYERINQIRYIKIDPKNKGFSNQRNIGIKNAYTPYIIFIDDDVEITKDWFDKFTSEFEKYEDKIFGAMGAVFPKKSNLISFICGVLGHPGGGFRFHNFSKGNNIFLSQVATCNTILNKKIVEDIGMFDPQNKFGSEDSELCLRIIKRYGNNKFLYIPSVIVWHYSPESFLRFIKWYIRRGISDIDLYLKHSIHLNYVIKTSIVLKFLILLIFSLIDIKIFFAGIFVYYFYQLFKHRFMFDYFKYYSFNFTERIYIFLVFPFLKLVADLMFDFGRIKRTMDFKIRGIK